MTLSFKRYIPYSERELKKGIKRKPLDARWKILSMKMGDDDDEYKISIQHIGTKCKSPERLIMNCSTKDKRQNEIGYIIIEHTGDKPNFNCVYGASDTSCLRAFLKVLRNPHFVMNMFGLKTKRTPYEYCIDKFGPIFDNPRCSEWQLHL